MIAVASPDKTDKFERKFSFTHCRVCGKPIITSTEPDGTVQLHDLPPDQGSPTEEPRDDPIRPASRDDVLSSPPRIPAQAVAEFQYADDVPDEQRIVPFSQVLKRQDGTRRTHEEAVKIYGDRGTWVAELNEALEARLRGAQPLSVPPRVFISYRWGSQEQNTWVEQLALELRSRGYFVAFDRTDCKPGISVPEFVSNLAGCQTFLAVLDPWLCCQAGSHSRSSG